MIRILLILGFCLTSIITFGKEDPELFCFKIIDYQIYSKKNGQKTLIYSSALQGKIVVINKNGKYSLIRENKVGLKIRSLRNGSQEFYIQTNSNTIEMPPVRYRSISELLDNKSITLDFEDPEMEVKLILFKEEEEENIYEKISTGSAFFIDSVHIVTNCHVIEDASRILISIGGIPYQCVPEKKSKTYDLAILRVIGYESRQSATFARGNAQVGDLCYAVGYPYSNIIGSDLKFTSGIISGRNGIAGDSTCYQITAPIDPGNSGCPLIDANGNIIGIISAKLKLGTNIGYAVKERYLFGLWPNLKYARKKATKTAPDIYKEASNYTYLIKSYIL